MLKVLIRKSLHVLPTELLLDGTRTAIWTVSMSSDSLYPYNGVGSTDYRPAD